MVAAYLALGSNIGDRAAHMATAVDALRSAPAVRVLAVSPFYETPPWGPVPQGPYLNACVGMDTELSPRALLALCLAIERSEGRERKQRWGPRTLDIDILTYGEETVDEADLVIPHPRLMERPFVLVPLATIAPDLTIAGTSIRSALADLDTSGIVPWREP